MKAIICDRYMSLEKLIIGKTDKPYCKDNEVLIEVHASSVNFNNLAFVIGKPLTARLWTGISKPKYPIPGDDVSGKIVEVGKNVTKFKVGDEVFGEISTELKGSYGAYAEFVSAPEDAILLKPSNLSFYEAAAVPEAATVALQGLRNMGKIKNDNKVLIYGASGGIGTFAVQIAKVFGAEVTGVCSTANLEMVKSIGADHVIDYTRTDFVKEDKKYDLILATAGYRSIYDYKRALSPKGIYVATGGTMQGPQAMAQIFEGLLIGPWLSMFGDKKLGSLTAKSNINDLMYLSDLIEAGRLKPVIDKIFRLDETAKALKYYSNGHARGKVIIAVK